MVKDRKNAEYLAKLDRSREQAERGETISFSIDYLKEMEKDDWKPTEKVKNFVEANMGSQKKEAEASYMLKK